MGRAPCCDKANVKKGPWAPEEDAKLKAFIENNGTGGNWITLPGKAGLKRCGKSCRLRWINYLRPDIKHGSFTEEEERIIYELHASFGSRWSLIAAQLPGRTDNDIKNYWNTRLKKKLAERQHLSYHHQRGGVQIAAFAHGRSGGGQNFTLPIGSGRRAAADGLLQQMIQPSMGEYYHHQSDIGHHNQYEFHQFSIVPPIQDGQNLELHHVRALQNEEAKLQLQQVRAFQIKDQAKLQLHAIEQAERERQRHQQQNTVVGGCIDERLMVIESSLRNCISSTTPTSVDSSGIRSSSGTAIYPLQATIGGNDLSSVGMISSHHNSSPTSSCSNISTDWSPYAPSVDLTYGDFQTHPSPAPVVAQDRYSSQDNYHALSAQQTQLVSQNYMNTSLLSPKLAQLAIGRGGVAASMGDAVMYHDIPREIVI